MTKQENTKEKGIRPVSTNRHICRVDRDTSLAFRQKDGEQKNKNDVSRQTKTIEQYYNKVYKLHIVNNTRILSY